jgi:hypothetical protein
MPAHALTHRTRDALDNLETYLSGLNEAVQYCVAYLADEVTQVPSGIMGGIQAGSVPPDKIVVDPEPEAFLFGAPAVPNAGTLSLNLATGKLDANWNAGGTPFSLSGYVNLVESIEQPSDRFFFDIHKAGSGFYIFSTTNI